MICLIALPVLGILAIFSATHRKLFYEAVDCVFRKATLRKCHSGLDERLKSNITGKLFRYSPKMGGWAFKKFEIISFVFVILMILSLFFSVQGAYYYVKYGNCNGEDSNAFCVFNLGQNEEDCGCSEDDENCNEDNNFKDCEGNCSCVGGECES